MHILVLGATGYAGRPAAQALRRAGHDVTGITRDPSSNRAVALAATEVRPVRGDLSDPDSYRAHLSDVDVVLHSTMDASDPVGADRRLFTELVAARDRDGRRRHLVYTTGCSIYGKVDAPVLDEATPGNPDHPLYFRMELEAELAASGLPFTVLRPGFLYGGEARTSMTGRWFADAADGGAVFYGQAGKTWSWLHVDDLAAAYVDVVARIDSSRDDPERSVDGQTYCLADDHPTAALDVLTACAQAAGRTGPVDHRPIADAGWLDQAGDQDEVMTTAHARRHLGWAPRHVGVVPEITSYHRAWQAARSQAR